MSDEELSGETYLESRIKNQKADEVFLTVGNVNHAIQSGQKPQKDSQVPSSP